MHFLETFKPLHHIFTFFSFQNTYSDDLPINIMHLYLPCPSWYLYDHTLYRWSIAFYCEVCRDVILNRVVAGGEHHHRVDMVRWLFFFLMAWYGGFACIGVGAVNGAKQGKGGQF